MKSAAQHSWVFGVGLLLAFMNSVSAQDAPSGNYQATVTDPASYVWDIPSIPNMTQDYSMEIQSDNSSVELIFPRPLQQAGSGKISGSGTQTVKLQVDDDAGSSEIEFPGTYKTTGVISSSRGLCKIKVTTTVTGTGELEGATRRLSATETLSVTVNNAALTGTGNIKSKASASGLGSISGTDSWVNEPLDEVGDGSWTLHLVNLTTTNKKVTGTAEATLHSAAVYQFSVKGTYNPKTHISKLVLSGQGITKGATLQVTIGDNDAITAIKGRLCGQAVDVTY